MQQMQQRQFFQLPPSGREAPSFFDVDNNNIHIHQSLEQLIDTADHTHLKLQA
jgi:hypothetical protein